MNNFDHRSRWNERYWVEKKSRVSPFFVLKSPVNSPLKQHPQDQILKSTAQVEWFSPSNLGGALPVSHYHQVAQYNNVWVEVLRVNIKTHECICGVPSRILDQHVFCNLWRSLLSAWMIPLQNVNKHDVTSKMKAAASVNGTRENTGRHWHTVSLPNAIL